jgi:hypothetical protein
VTRNRVRSWREESGRPAADVRLAVFSHLHVTESSRETGEDFYPYYSAYLEPLFKGPMPPSMYEQMLSPDGALVGGRVAPVVRKATAKE